MPEIATATPSSPTVSIPSVHQQFLDVFRKEAMTTIRVLKAFPPERSDFKPHEDSRTALELAWNFVVEQRLSIDAANGTWKMPPHFPAAPPTFDDVVSEYERGVDEVVQAVTNAPMTRFFDTVAFFTGPKRMGDMTVIDMLWLMLMDMVHHRGQLSVYVRMTGGKVPSIYGPSKDEPWT